MRVIKTKDGREILLPSNDYVFKLLFGDERNKSILKAFLAVVLGIDKKGFDLSIMPTELLPESSDDKYGILDVCVKTNTGKIINIEIQVVKSAAFIERITFYKSKLIVGQIGKNDWYGKIKKTICIVITDFALIENSDPNRYHHIFRLHDPVDGTYFGNFEEIQLFELVRLPKFPDGTPLWEWITFLNVKAEEELAMIKEKNAEISSAVDQLYRISASADVRLRYEMREKAWRDEYARLVYSQEEGLRQGLEQGLEQGIQQGIQQGIVQGVQQGIQQGREEGIQQGLEQGIQKRSDDILKLIEQGLTTEQIRARLIGGGN